MCADKWSKGPGSFLKTNPLPQSKRSEKLRKAFSLMYIAGLDTLLEGVYSVIPKPSPPIW